MTTPTMRLPVLVRVPRGMHSPQLDAAMIAGGYHFLKWQTIPDNWLIAIDGVPTFHGTDPDAAAYYVSFARAHGNAVTLTAYDDAAQA